VRRRDARIMRRFELQQHQPGTVSLTFVEELDRAVDDRMPGLAAAAFRVIIRKVQVAVEALVNFASDVALFAVAIAVIAGFLEGISHVRATARGQSSRPVAKVRLA